MRPSDQRINHRSSLDYFSCQGPAATIVFYIEANDRNQLAAKELRYWSNDAAVAQRRTPEVEAALRAVLPRPKA
jgi:hypothetical protein